MWGFFFQFTQKIDYTSCISYLSRIALLFIQLSFMMQQWDLTKLIHSPHLYLLFPLAALVCLSITPWHKATLRGGYI